MSFRDLIEWQEIFPDPQTADDEGLVAFGGSLKPAWLIEAYCSGIFPWYSEGDPILWWSPDPRMVLMPGEFRLSDSLRRSMKKTQYSLRIDSAFGEVIRACATVERPGNDGTWISDDMIKAYEELHELGLAHSFEIWTEGILAAGLYGVSIGKAFFGESMFHRLRDGSKMALYHLSQIVFARGFHFIDVQMHTSHLESLGARLIPRDEYLAKLRKAVTEPGHYVRWNDWAE